MSNITPIIHEEEDEEGNDAVEKFKFSLTSHIQNYKGNVIANVLSDDTYSMNTIIEQLDPIDTYTMNKAILTAVSIYKTEIMNTALINEDIDNLNKKTTKGCSYLDNFKTQIDDFKVFIDTTLQKDNESKRKVINDINDITERIHKCQFNIKEYVKDIKDSNSQSYANSSSNLDAINNVITLVKHNKHACPVCLENSTTHFAIPCGHVYCEECSSKLRSRCFICRDTIYRVSPLFFS
jgi:hypothetical protein